MINKLFGQEWSSDYYLAYNCEEKNGYLYPAEVFNFCEMGKKIYRVEKNTNLQNRPIRTVNQPELENSIFTFSIWEPETNLPEKVRNKFYEPY